MQRTVLAMAAALSLLAGCASQVTSNPKTGVPVIQYEQKPFTPDIERVRASTTAYHPTLTVGEAFDRYQSANRLRASGKSWSRAASNFPANSFLAGSSRSTGPPTKRRPPS